MKKKPFYSLVTMVLLAAGVAKADITVSDVTAKQRYPWNGLVDISCTVSGIGEADGKYKFAVAAVDADSGAARDVSHVQLMRDGTASADLTVSTNGACRLLWNAHADLGEVVSSNMVVRISLTKWHDRVQLWEGGPFWATTNVGADEPWEYGYYFWWGDTVGYKYENGAWVASDDSSQNLLYSGHVPTYEQSVATLQSEGWITPEGVLALEHDVANVQWGGCWRLPTMQDQVDLYNNCDWTWTTTNGVNGYFVCGRGDYTSASIFLPAAGNGWGIDCNGAGSQGDYWSSVPASGLNDAYSFSLGFNIYNRYPIRYVGRSFGVSVRPVQEFTDSESGGDSASRGDSAPFPLDTRTGVRLARAAEPLAYSTDWNGSEGCSISIDGSPPLSNATGTGDYVWNAAVAPRGLNAFTFEDGMETLTATFRVGRGILEVVCPYAGCEPVAGTNEYDWGNTVTASAPAYFVDGQERHTCTGWTGTGSVPASGLGIIATFTLEDDSTLTWLWKTEYKLDLAVEGSGTLSQDSGWFTEDAMAVITATPDQYQRFVRWVGNTNGCSEVGTTLQVPMTQGRSIRAVFEPELNTLAVTNALGSASPTNGLHTLNKGMNISAWSTNHVEEGCTRFVCTGWTGTGSVPATGSGTNAVFTLLEDSALTWLWKTEYKLDLAVDGKGMLSQEPGWIAENAMVVITATPAQYWHFVEWEGDTAGCRVTGSTLRAPMTQGRSIRAVFAPDMCALAIENAFGAAWPTNGTAFLNKGTAVSAWSAGVVEEGRTQTICTGWTGTGSVPAAGTGTNAVFTLLEDSSIAWAWQTNYLVRVTVVGDGTADIGEAWIEAGSNLVVTAVAGETAYASAIWSGDIDGAAINGLSISVPMDKPRDLVLTFEAMGLGQALEQPSLVWATAGAMAWTPVGDGAHDGADAAMAAAVGNGSYDDGTLRVVVDGGGELTFWWRLDVSSGSAGIDLRVDGEYAEDVWLVEETGWTQASITLGEGSHTVEWIFWSDGGGASACLDEVSFIPEVTPITETQTTPVHVPYALLDGFGLGDGTEAGYEAVAASMASNGLNRVWECYVAGLSPTNPDDRFSATLALIGGVPVVTWTPKLTLAEEAKRKYTIFGKGTLADENWMEISAGEESLYNFFRVTVEMR